MCRWNLESRRETTLSLNKDDADCRVDYKPVQTMRIPLGECVISGHLVSQEETFENMGRPVIAVLLGDEGAFSRLFSSI